jgi:hypothetical protein
MRFLTTYIYDPPIWLIVLGLAIFLVPAAILWGIARSHIHNTRLNLILKSVALGLMGTAALVAFSICRATGTLAGHYHLYTVSRIDPMFWLVSNLNFPAASAVSVVVLTLISLGVFKLKQFRSHV